MSELSTFEPKKGDTIMVRNTPLTHGVFPHYAQRFIIKLNGKFYCERDDGDQSELIGWDEGIPNQGYAVYLTKDAAVDHAQRDREELEKLMNRPTSTVIHCSVCNELLAFEDKSTNPPDKSWHVSPCGACMDKVKSSVKALSTALKELIDE